MKKAEDERQQMDAIPHEGEVKKLFRRKEFKTVRAVGYVATCDWHFPGNSRVQQIYNEADVFATPRVCVNTREYADALSYARRMANVTHKKTGCSHTLKVTLNVS